jgi:phosphoribosylformimino-5-aminoimidazole carboxamide ribotide isomerase
MEIIPAIDIRKGKCVRLVQGDLRDETIYSQEPVSMAKLWKLKGAKRLHVIDLDGAFSGKLTNLEIVKEIIQNTGLSVQMGGGIRDFKTIERVLSAGVDKVILGTAMVLDRAFLKKAIQNYHQSMVAGIDAKKGMVAIRGWKQVTKIRAIDLVREIEQLGISTVVFTDIQRDGMLEGPNFKSIKELASAVHIPVIASGGMSCLADLEHLKKIEKYGVKAVIIGKALYTGKIDLKMAIKIAKDPVVSSVPRKKNAR